MEHTQIEADVARELTWSDPGDVVDGWELVALDDKGNGRWTSHHWCVIRPSVRLVAADFGLYGFAYEEGLTEMQDYSSLDSDKPVSLFPVTTKPVTTVEYVRGNDE